MAKLIIKIDKGWNICPSIKIDGPMYNKSTEATLKLAIDSTPVLEIAQFVEPDVEVECDVVFKIANKKVKVEKFKEAVDTFTKAVMDFME